MCNGITVCCCRGASQVPSKWVCKVCMWMFLLKSAFKCRCGWECVRYTMKVPHIYMLNSNSSRGSSNKNTFLNPLLLFFSFHFVRMYRFDLITCWTHWRPILVKSYHMFALLHSPSVSLTYPFPASVQYTAIGCWGNYVRILQFFFARQKGM